MSGRPHRRVGSRLGRALADAVYERHGACHLLFNNAGVTSGGGGRPWEQEPNDWRWCFGVNVFGVANGILAFVPRMIEGGEEGVIVNTSSGDGGIAPVPYASVYASSKAAISCLTEALAHQLDRARAPRLRAAVFYPSGGLHGHRAVDRRSATGRPSSPRTEERAPGPVPTFEQFREHLASLGKPADVADLDELGRFVVDGVKAGRYVIAHDLDQSAALLHARADAIGRGELPPHHGI